MKRIDRTVLRETVYIAVFTLILSVLMQSVFLIINKWDYTVLCGNILGIVAAVGNFLLMGITVQNALEKDEKEAAKLVKFSQRGRLFLLFVVALLAYLIPIFNIVATVIPLIFPRIAIAARPFIIKD